MSSQDRDPTWTCRPLPDPAAHQAWFLCCPGGLPEVLRAVLASLGGCSSMPRQTPVQPQTGIDWGMAAVAQAGWFAFKGRPRESMTPSSGSREGSARIPTLPVDLRVGLSLSQGLGQCPQPAGLVLQQQGQGWALGAGRRVSKHSVMLPDTAEKEVGQERPQGPRGQKPESPPHGYLVQAAPSTTLATGTPQGAGAFHGSGAGFTGELRPREVEQLAQGCTASEWQSRGMPRPPFAAAAPS